MGWHFFTSSSRDLKFPMPLEGKGVKLMYKEDWSGGGGQASVRQKAWRGRQPREMNSGRFDKGF